jgi:hypothetical protein
MFNVGDHVTIPNDDRVYVVVAVHSGADSVTYDLALASNPKTVVLTNQPDGGMKIATT